MAMVAAARGCGASSTLASSARVLLSEYFIRNRTEPMHVQISVALVVLGAVIAGWETIIAVRVGA